MNLMGLNQQPDRRYGEQLQVGGQLAQKLAGASEIRRTSAVDQQIEQLRLVVGQLEDRCATLRDRLQPVSSAVNVAQAGGNLASTPDESLCPVGEALRSFRRRIEAQAACMQTALELLEI